MLAFLLSPIGKRVAGGVLVLVFVLGLTAYIYQKGKAAGYGDGQRIQLELDRKAFEQERAEFLKTLAHYQEEDNRAKEAIAAKDLQLAQLQLRRDAVRKSVAALPAGNLIPDIKTRLGLASDGVLDEAALRRIDDAIALTEVLQEEVRTLTEKSQEQDKRIDAISRQRDSAVEYSNQLTKHYTAAYNAAQQHHNWFINLLHGRLHDKRLDLPSPESLHP